MKTKTFNNKPKTGNQSPLVSVIMPVYNAGGFLTQAIESILKQTYKNWELIIVDDASTDNSWKTITYFQKLYPKKIRAFQTPKQTNAAGNGATNYGMKYAKGTFIARMDADDISLPKRLEKQVVYMLSHPELILLGTQATVINQTGKIIGQKIMPTTHQEIYKQYGVFHPMIHPSVMIRKKLLPNKKRIYEMKWGTNDDYYTFFKLLNHGLFANLNESLIKYRVHGKNFSLIKPKTKFMHSVKIRLEAMRKLNYAMSLHAFLLMTIQWITISVLPESLIIPIYLIVRGIQPLSTVIKNTFAPVYSFARYFVPKPPKKINPIFTKLSTHA